MANLGCPLRSFKVPMIDIGKPGPATLRRSKTKLVLAPELGKFFFEVFDHQFVDAFRRLRRYQSDAHFSRVPSST